MGLLFTSFLWFFHTLLISIYPDVNSLQIDPALTKPSIKDVKAKLKCPKASQVEKS